MNPTDKQALAWLDQELADLDRRNLRRRLRTREGVQAGRIVLDGRELVNFGSNDYLGLAADPRLAAAVAAGGRARRLGQRGQPACHRPCRTPSALGAAAGRVRGDRGRAAVYLGLRRQRRHDRRTGRAWRRRLRRPQEPRQPVGRLPPLAGRCPRLSASRLAATRSPAGRCGSRSQGGREGDRSMFSARVVSI